MNAIAKQGHRYRVGAVEVLAMESGPSVRVRPIVATDYGTTELGPALNVPAQFLTAQPMRYFHGVVPA
jgi:hypothetical protein